MAEQLGGDHQVGAAAHERRRERVPRRSVSALDGEVFAHTPQNHVFDPQIQWDPQSRRWYYLADNVPVPESGPFTGPNSLVFGWSKTDDPSDLRNGWCRFAVPSSSSGDLLDDYPKLGHDNHHLIFGANVFENLFSPGDISFKTSRIWAVRKPAKGDTSCQRPTYSFFGDPASSQFLRTADGDIAFTPVPANTFGGSEAGNVVSADYPFVGDVPDTQHQIMVWHVGGSAASPVLREDGNINVDPYTVPENVPQPGTTARLDNTFSQLTNAVAVPDTARPGHLRVWTQQSIDDEPANGPFGRGVVRWYELLPDGGAGPRLRQFGTIRQPAPLAAFNGAISPTADGTGAVIDYNTGGPSQLAQLRAQGRSGSTPIGQMDGEILLGNSRSNDTDFTCDDPPGAPCRWGDYAGASPDPLVPSVVWGSGELIGRPPLAPGDPNSVTRNFAVQVGSRR